MILNADFFNRNTLKVARDLIGKFIVTREEALLINEVEAYVGPHDLACHASHGKMERTKTMFSPAGFLYVYFVYGMHWMLNVVTEEAGYPAAVLIRGAGDINGPARLTKFLKIDGRYNNLEASKKTGLWFEDRGIIIPNKDIKRTERIGISYAGPIWAKKPYRFIYWSE